MMMTATVPISSARGTLRPGSRISSAMYAAAFHPEYVNITGIEREQPVGRAHRARRLLERLALDPSRSKTRAR